MNKKQKIVLIIGAFLIISALVVWVAQGGHIFTKTQILIERQDELFGTTYKEWEDKLVVGLDYAGGISAIVALLTGILIFTFRNKKSKE
ncbi:MAG: hypothetical protein JSW63_11650 [Ignavibacterium sp.]|nr:MAG: hypothetical protein JSW63_11650 [Ignavibacterium sp.]